LLGCSTVRAFKHRLARRFCPFQCARGSLNPLPRPASTPPPPRAPACFFLMSLLPQSLVYCRRMSTMKSLSLRAFGGGWLRWGGVELGVGLGWVGVRRVRLHASQVPTPPQPHPPLTFSYLARSLSLLKVLLALSHTYLWGAG
jgi:hypothetical protein